MRPIDKQIERRTKQLKQLQQTRTNHKILTNTLPLEIAVRKTQKLKTLQKNIKESTALIDKYNKVKMLTESQKNKLLDLRDKIQNQQHILYTTQQQQKQYDDLRKRTIRDFHTHDLPIKFSSNYYHFLKNYMMNDDFKTAYQIINRYPTQSQKGLAFEAMWTILLSLGCCSFFSPENGYNFYNAELKENSYYFIQEIVSNEQYYNFLRQTPVKGPNGKSDITLRNNKTGTWIFISCKFYITEHGTYDIDNIYKTIQETNKKYGNMIGNNYKIYVFANNKEDARTIIKGSDTIKDIIKKNPGFKNNIKINDEYNVFGIHELEQCFHSFKMMAKKTSSWDDFQKTYLKHYDHLSSLALRMDQVPIVEKTFLTIWDNIKQKRCRTNNTTIPEQQQPLHVYWKTVPQFGKTYCIGAFLLRCVESRPFMRELGTFNSVIVVDKPGVAEKYMNEVLGGHRQFIDADFKITFIKNRKPAGVVPLSQYLRTPAMKKPDKILDKNKNLNNIFVVLKEDLELVYNLPNLKFIIFDEYDKDNSVTNFDKFVQSPTKIGLFLTSSDPLLNIQTRFGCSYIFKWDAYDVKALQQISQQLQRSPQKTLSQLQSTKSFTEKHKQTYGLSLSNPLVRSTKQDIRKCVPPKVYLVSDYLNPEENNYNEIFRLDVSSGGGDDFVNKPQVNNLLRKIENVLTEISEQRGSEKAFTTQLWSLPSPSKTSNTYKISTLLKNMIKRTNYFGDQYDVVIYKEPSIKSNANRHPTPLAGRVQKLIRHYENIAKSNGKNGLIFLIDPSIDLKGLSLRNVDVVFSLHNDIESDADAGMMSYMLMSKCMTPKQTSHDKVFFVDFNRSHIENLLRKGFGGNLHDVINKRLVRLMDASTPTLNTKEIADRLKGHQQVKQIFGDVVQKALQQGQKRQKAREMERRARQIQQGLQAKRTSQAQSQSEQDEDDDEYRSLRTQDFLTVASGGARRTNVSASSIRSINALKEWVQQTYRTHPAQKDQKIKKIDQYKNRKDLSSVGKLKQAKIAVGLQSRGYNKKEKST